MTRKNPIATRAAHSGVALTVAALAFAPGCGASKASPDAGTPSGANDGSPCGADGGGIAPPLNLPAPTVNITWAPTTTFLDESQVSLVKSIDSSTGLITLDSAGVKAAQLDLSDGRIIVVYGQAMATITSSTDDGTTVTLQTGPASLADAATHAELDFEQATEWTPEAAMAAAKKMNREIRRDLKGGGNHVSFDLPAGGDYTLSIDATLYGDHAEFTITGAKNSGSITAKMTATGQVGRFVEHHHVLIDSGALQDYEVDNNHIEGSMTLSAVAAASGDDALNYSPTLPLFVWPGLIGPIPVEMSTSIQFVADAVVPSSASVNVTTDFDFNSDIGYEFNGTTFNAQGNVGPYSVQKGGTLQSGGPTAVTYNAGIGFPRMSFSVFGSFADVWAQPAFDVGGSFTFFPACQTATAAFIGAAGYDLTIFDKVIKIGSSGTTEFWDIKKPLLTAGSCGDAGGGG
jgi:hypothetical protein